MEGECEPLSLGKVAKRAAALRFMLVSSLGASSGSSLLCPRTKGECEAAISAIGFSTLVIVRPSFLVGARSEARPAEALHCVSVDCYDLCSSALFGSMHR